MFLRHRTGAGPEDEGLKTLRVFMAARETEANDTCTMFGPFETLLIAVTLATALI